MVSSKSLWPVLVFGLSVPALAAEVYQDRTEFLSAVAPGYYLETFDTDLQMMQAGNEVVLGPANGFSYKITSEDILYYWGSDFSSLSSDTMGADHPFSAVVFDLSSSPVTAFGGTLFLTDLNFSSVVWGSLLVELNDGTSISLYEPFESSFLGFTSDTPITSVTLTPSGGGFLDQEPYVTFDDVIAGTVLPEPASVLLFVLGVGLLRGECRRWWGGERVSGSSQG